MLALVLPLTAAMGLSWQNFRQLLSESYTDISVVSIAASGGKFSFSSDTGIAECLVMACKRRVEESIETRMHCTSLGQRPVGLASSSAIANNLFEVGLGLWGNGTLGLMMHWWHSNRQQAGRGTSSVRALESLPVLDFRSLSDEQLATAEDIFNDFRDRELKPAYLADADPNRGRG